MYIPRATATQLQSLLAKRKKREGGPEYKKLESVGAARLRIRHKPFYAKLPYRDIAKKAVEDMAHSGETHGALRGLITENSFGQHPSLVPPTTTTTAQFQTSQQPTTTPLPPPRTEWERMMDISEEIN